ncbi:MAG TPA: hypothetical protein VGB94_07935 [Acidobacteriaceae bacterium]
MQQGDRNVYSYSGCDSALRLVLCDAELAADPGHACIIAQGWAIPRTSLRQAVYEEQMNGALLVEKTNDEFLASSLCHS